MINMQNGRAFGRRGWHCLLSAWLVAAAPAMAADDAPPPAPELPSAQIPVPKTHPPKEGEPLSEAGRRFKELVAEAVRRHPAIGSAESQRLQRERDADFAYSQLLPQVDAGTNMVSSGSNPPVVVGLPNHRLDGTATITQLVYDFGATFDRINSTKSQVKAAELSTEGLENSYVLKAIQTYFDVIRYRDLVAAEQRQVARLTTLMGNLKERAEAGVGTEADVLRGQSRVAEANATLSSYVGKMERAKASYRELFGAVAPDDLVLPHIKLVQVESADADTQVASATEHNPTLLRQKALTDAVSHEADAAEEDLLPKLQLQASGTRYSLVGAHANANDYDYTVQLQVIYKLFTGGADTAKARAAEERFKEQKYDYETASRELERDVRLALADVATSTQRIESLDLSARADKAALAAYVEQFKAGRARFLDILDAERAASASDLNLTDTRIDLELSKFSVMALTADLLPFFGLNP